MKNLAIAALLFVNVMLGLGVAALVYEPQEAKAQAALPQEYLILPVNAQGASVFCIINAQQRKILIVQLQGQRVTPILPALDLSTAFTNTN